MSVVVVDVVLASSPTSLTILLILRAFFSARLSSDVRLWKCDVPFILLKSFLYLSWEGNAEWSVVKRGHNTSSFTTIQRLEGTHAKLFVSSVAMTVTVWWMKLFCSLFFLQLLHIWHWSLWTFKILERHSQIYKWWKNLMHLWCAAFCYESVSSVSVILVQSPTFACMLFCPAQQEDSVSFQHIQSARVQEFQEVLRSF